MALFPASQAFTMLFYPSVPRTHSIPTARTVILADPEQGFITRWFVHLEPKTPHTATGCPRKSTRKAYHSSLRERFAPLMSKLREKAHIPNTI
ncbi:hypothetical protein PENSPDRAFT_647186 [Peniophora sp. CONT]|nr:hypothetical protein PENSPDRAFT_647186 [Peniophora sp. CONT]